jgi:hypothetical protein
MRVSGGDIYPAALRPGVGPGDEFLDPQDMLFRGRLKNVLLLAHEVGQVRVCSRGSERDVKLWCPKDSRSAGLGKERRREMLRIML